MSVIDWLLDSDPSIDPLATFARPARSPTIASPKRIAIVEEKRDAAADGRSRSRTRARTTSRWTRARASPVVGTRCARCECIAAALPKPVTQLGAPTERKTGVKHAEVITARLVQDERGWLRLAG